MMTEFAKLITSSANAIVPYMLGALMLTGLILTIRLRFVQVRRFGEAIRETSASRQTGASGALAPLQSFMTALAGSIGTGNIAGVATAIVAGGPGALFWIWCYGFFAMATKFAEASLGMHFRFAKGDNVLSGPMYYLRDGLKSPALAWIFALLAGIGVLFTTPMTQTNSVADVVNAQFERHNISLGDTQIGTFNIHLNRLAVAAVLAVLT